LSQRIVSANLHRMNFRKTLLGSALLSLIFLSGCENCDTTDPMTSSYFTLKFVDINGKNLVNASSGPYYPDSVRAFVKDNSALSFQIQEGGGLTETQYVCMPPFSEAGKTELYFHLNQQDMDTLLISYKAVMQKCGGTYFIYTAFHFNGKGISPASILKLVK